MAYFRSHSRQEFQKMQMLKSLWNRIVHLVWPVDSTPTWVIPDTVPVDPDRDRCEMERRAYGYFEGWLRRHDIRQPYLDGMARKLTTFTIDRAITDRTSTLAAALEVRKSLSESFGDERRSIAVFYKAAEHGFVFDDFEDTMYFMRAIRERYRTPGVHVVGSLLEEEMAANCMMALDIIGETIATEAALHCQPGSFDATTIVAALWLLESSEFALVQERVMILDIAGQASEKMIGVNQIKSFLLAHGHEGRERLLMLFEQDVMSVALMQLFIDRPDSFSGVHSSGMKEFFIDERATDRAPAPKRQRAPHRAK